MTGRVVTTDEGVSALCEELRSAGAFFIDLEFVSEDRYVPDLALVQLAWGAPDSARVAAVDPLSADPLPVFELVASPEVLTVAHGAKQDLGLIGTRHSLTAHRFADTQIAAAFAGIAEQIGYARLVKRLLGVDLDKGPQYTNWLERPLPERRLEYAFNDVRYLPGVWAHLEECLQDGGRLSWAFEESQAMADTAAVRREPDTVYRTIGGWSSLKPAALGALRAVAAWRERTALESNKPPVWILTEPAMVEICRRGSKNEGDLRRVRGIGQGISRRYGAQILEAIRTGASDPPDVERPPPALEGRELAHAYAVQALVYLAASGAGLSPRLVASKADAEALVRYAASGEKGEEPLLLTGWRGELCGRDALAFLAGDVALRRDGVVR